ncbi:unnamed protein product [Ambrosiozyma monospora]|uniref:Unnamed protein product n=1 Tax=Ambrosiozyma monospora TaxID=43982 RepID=A0ACB5TC07_AMBMO|nr:unnamed protein product [Ambrosiozyma monospora]
MYKKRRSHTDLRQQQKQEQEQQQQSYENEPSQTRTPVHHNDLNTMTNNFKTSVVRHTNNAGMAKNKLRNQLSRQELSDIFQNLDVRDREGYLSTVQEQDDDYDSDVDEDYRNKVVTLTKENVDLFNETADDFEDQLNPNSPLSNPKMMMLAKYMEIQK